MIAGKVLLLEKVFYERCKGQNAILWYWHDGRNEI